MKYAIRYYSKFGHSKQMSEAIESLVGVKSATVAEPIEEAVDILFLGAGVFLGSVNKSVMQFIDALTPDKVGCVVLFGSCAIIESPVPQMRKALEARGIKVSDKSFTCKGSMGPVHSGHPNAEDIERFRTFVKEVVEK
ncbi:MAG: hypothetical protein IJ621_04525 [Paludibacteraceae bacterium]|nr:hypothetical protein [Paludibacteraceae bacterium]